MTGPKEEYSIVLFAHLSIIFEGILCAVFVMPYYCIYISYIIPLLHLFLFLISWILLTLCQLRDPGIVLSIVIISLRGIYI